MDWTSPIIDELTTALFPPNEKKIKADFTVKEYTLNARISARGAYLIF